MFEVLHRMFTWTLELKRGRDLKLHAATANHSYTVRSLMGLPRRTPIMGSAATGAINQRCSSQHAARQRRLRPSGRMSQKSWPGIMALQLRRQTKVLRPITQRTSTRWAAAELRCECPFLSSQTGLQVQTAARQLGLVQFDQCSGYHACRHNISKICSC